MKGGDHVRALIATVAAALAALLVVAVGPGARDSVNRMSDWTPPSTTTIVLNPTHG